ncbi:MAG: hypothetical protein RL701_8156, partial [Pseudomonadota bacterium]
MTKGSMTDSNYMRTVLLACLLPLASCIGTEEDAAYADVDLIDMRSLALSGSDVQSVNGTYTNCKNRTGSWSLAVTGTPTLDHSPLSVIQGDTACALALTEITTGTDGKLAAGTAIALGASYVTAQAFGS